MPKASRAWSWRTTVNRSLLPVSVSPENRRHLLYAVLQDLVPSDLLLHENTSSVSVLAEMDERLAPFDDVYRVPAKRSSDRLILFPLHVAVPTVFDTYERTPQQKPQTDKGFRGKFIDFFSSDDAGFFDDHLHRVLRNLFTRQEGMTPLDSALVEALSTRVLEQRSEKLEELIGNQSLAKAVAGDPGWWLKIFPELPNQTNYRPLPEFAEQGERLHDDIDAVAHTFGLSRIERVAAVERILAYHFALYMVRLTRCLYMELDWVYRELWPNQAQTPWTDLDLRVRFHERRAQVPREYHDEYKDFAEQLNEAYLLLPVLNNVELAIRGVVSERTGHPSRMSDCCWAEARGELIAMGEEDRSTVRQLIAVLAESGRVHAGISTNDDVDGRLEDEPVEMLFDAIRVHYTTPSERRYPKDHHQTVFDTVAGAGSTSFLQKHPFRHVVLGDELLYLLVLSLFERRDPSERGDSTCVPREARQLRRARLPLRELEDRLAEDLLVPANDRARRDLRASLSRLGLLDRLSDVGEGNFLRHPTGV